MISLDFLADQDVNFFVSQIIFIIGTSQNLAVYETMGFYKETKQCMPIQYLLSIQETVIMLGIYLILPLGMNQGERKWEGVANCIITKGIILKSYLIMQCDGWMWHLFRDGWIILERRESIICIHIFGDVYNLVASFPIHFQLFCHNWSYWCFEAC